MIKNNKMNSITLSIATLLQLSSCNWNPLKGQDEAKLSETKPTPTGQVRGSMSLDLPDVVEFVEGTKRDFFIQSYVPTGEEKIQVSNLPDGAIFDSKEKIISWTPDYQAANDANDPKVISKSYVVSISLSSSNDQKTVVQSKVTFFVKDQPRTTTVNAQRQNWEVKEGEELKETFQILSDDFPKGPYQVSLLQNFGAMIQKVQGTEDTFEVSFTPSYQEVIYQKDSYIYGKDFVKKDFMVSVSLPSGRTDQFPLSLKVKDQRNPVQISVPSEVRATSELVFTVSLQDLNFEMKPKLEASIEGVGELEVTANPSSKDFEQSYVVGWKDIPNEYFGKKVPVLLKACVLGVRNYYARAVLCEEKTIQALIDQKDYPQPTMERSFWKDNEIKYFIQNQDEKFTFSTTPAANELTSVEVSGTDEASVSNSWSNHVLYISPKQVGLKKFNLSFTTKFGKRTTESFLYEVLPSDWSSMLIAMDNFRDSEASLTIKATKTGNFFNPVFQKLDQRMMTKRSKLWITSGALSNPEAVKTLEENSDQFKDIYLFSPLLQNLNGKLKKEINLSGVGLYARWSQLPNSEPLKNQILFASKEGGFSSAREEVKFLGTTTAQSSNPLVLVKSQQSDCRSILYADDPNTPLGENIMMMMCKRSNGGRLWISGFEWADLTSSTAAQDPSTLESWMSQILK